MRLVKGGMFCRSVRVASVVALPLLFLSFAAFAQQAHRTPAHRPAPMFIPNQYTVILQDAPVSARFATRDDMKSPAAAAYRAQIVAAQRRFRTAVEGRGMHVTGSVTDLLNAVFVSTDTDRGDELRALPGVAMVTLARRVKLSLNKALTAMNAQAAWSAVGGQSNAGAGVKIGIIDTGIDQTHPAFQDSSLKAPAGYPICTTGHPEDCAYTNNKVIVARSYVRQLAMANVSDPTNPAAQSQPDDFSPRDRMGHGTATATCAAGFTALSPALDANGNAITINGMAPKAFLGNYKVQGSPGVNDGATDQILIQAVDDAVSDGMDVISISLGSIALTDVAHDPAAMAFEAAAQKAVVIAAAGNDGGDLWPTYPYFNSISSPGTAPSVISVGATVNSHAFNPNVIVNSSSAPSSLKNIQGVSGDSNYLYFGSMTGPLVDVTTVGDNGLACGTLPAGSLNNSIALIERGTCSFDQKAISAQTAGAIGIVFYMSDGSATIGPGGISTDFFGPTIMISNSDGVNLKNYIDANKGQTVNINYTGVEQDVVAYSNANGVVPPLEVNQLASYSSMGPTPDGRIKPDLVATGGDDNSLVFTEGMLTGAQSYDPNGEVYSTNRYVVADGTSFSTPITAGAAALVKQAHPNFTPAQIRSAIVNSTAQDTTTDDMGDSVDVQWIGAGRLNAGNAITATVTAAPVSASFGFATAAGSLPAAIPITLTNSGSSSVNLTAALTTNIAPTGATFAVSPATLTLAAGATGTITVSVTGKVPAPGEYSGGVNVTGTGVSLRIPYMMLVGDGQVALAEVDPLSSVAFGYPGQDGGPMIVQVVDQFGVPIANSPVVFSVPSRGAVTLRSYGNGEPACSPASSTSSVTCNTDQFGWAYADVLLGSRTGTPVINILAAGQSFSGNAIIATAPSISSGGVVNDATFQSAVAPGSYVAIFGTGLLDTGNLSNQAYYNNQTYELAGPSTLMADGSLPLQLDFTSVSFDVPSAGISVPGYVYFTSASQVNVYVPWELAGQSSVQMKVNVDEGFYSNVVTVPLTNAAPGFFLNSGNVADALDQNFNIITSSNPAVRGQTIQLFCNGLGPVSNTPPSGSPALASPLSQTTTTPVVTIGGQPATVTFSGLAPGIVGEYQVNVTVPSGISAGSQPITISIAGQNSPSQTAGSSPQTIMIPVK